MLAEIISFLANSLTITVLVAYVFALWAALVAWTWIDIVSRTDSPLYRLGAILIVATGAILGFAIYLLLRPNITKDEVQLREIEEALLASQTSWQSCPKCNYPVKEEFLYCTNCSEKLMLECKNCNREINISWNICAYCGSRQREEEVKIVISTRPKLNLRETGVAVFSSISGLLRKLNESRNSLTKTQNGPGAKSRKSKRAIKSKQV
ncbi:MAG: zinc ribbon domain-containing protein [Candidatus Woykebacteria bacterium]